MPITVTTDLPDEDQPVLGNGVEDEVAVDRETAVSNYGSVRIQIRETGESSWDANATGFGEFIGAFNTLQMEFVGREDGEEYEVRARAETEHVTGAWTDPVSIITEFPGATQFTATAQGSDAVLLEWQDNADNEDGSDIWRREELDPRRDTGFGDWVLIDTVDPNVESYTDSTVAPNHDYEYYVEPYTEYTSATSSIDSTTTEIEVPTEGWFIVLQDGTGEYATVEQSAFNENQPVIQPEEKAVGRWRVDIRPTEILREWLGSEAYIYHNGNLWMRGPFTRYHPDGGQGDAAAQLEGLDTLEDLNRGGTVFSVQSEPGYQAFERFFTEELDDWTVTVTPPAADVINEGFVVQNATSASDFESVFETALADDTKPVGLKGDRLEPLQTCWVFEGENPEDSDLSINAPSDPAYSGGSAGEFGLDDGYGVWTVTPEHTIPADRVGFAIRDAIIDDGSRPSGITISFNGEVLDAPTGIENSLGWRQLGDDSFYDPNYDGYTGGDLEAGETYEIRIEIENGTPGGYRFDVPVVYDTKYPPTFTNDNGNDSSHLNTPREYQPVVVEAEPFGQEFNIASATLTTTIDDVSTDQQLQASNDGGDTWLPNDGTEANTTAITADFATAEIYGTEVRGRVTLGGYGERDDAVPRLGYQPQALSSWELQIDTNALRVIDDQTYTGSPFEILDSIAGDSRLTFVGDYREDGRHLNAFVPGDEVRSIDWTVTDATPVDTLEGYYNSITVFGPEDDTGERLTATASSQAAIDERGEIPGPAKFRPDADTKPELISIARSLLADGLAKDTFTGALTIESQLVQPGYAYPVEEFDAEGPFVLKDAKFEWGEMTLDFEGRNSLVRPLRSIETEVRTTKRAL